MRRSALYYRFGTDHDCIVNIYYTEWDPVPGTGGKVAIPIPKTLNVRFHEQARAKAWPQVISGDAGPNYSIFLFARKLAEDLVSAGFSGIEFFPVIFELGDLKGLKGKELLRPEYLWARVSGIVYVDLYLGDRKVMLDPSGRRALEKRSASEYWKIRPRPTQPEAGDFSRLVPGALFTPVVTPRVAAYFVSLKLKEVTIAATEDGGL